MFNLLFELTCTKRLCLIWIVTIRNKDYHHMPKMVLVSQSKRNFAYLPNYYTSLQLDPFKNFNNAVTPEDVMSR